MVEIACPVACGAGVGNDRRKREGRILRVWPAFFSTFVTLSRAVEGGILGLILPLFLAKFIFRV
jgi:hypothetical protein